MAEQDNQADDDGLHDRITATIRRAVSMEQHQFHLSVTIPLLDNILAPIMENQRQILETLAEHSRSIGLLIDGQALIEKTLGGAFNEPDEPWRESLD